MEIETIWANGVFRPIAPIKLKDTRVTIQVPNEKIINVGQIEEKPTTPLDVLLAKHPYDPWLNRMRTAEEKILALPDNQLPELTEEQLERIAAFAHREDR